MTTPRRATTTTPGLPTPDAMRDDETMSTGQTTAAKRDADLLDRIRRMGTDPQGYYADARAAALPAARARAQRAIKAASQASRRSTRAR